MLASRKSPVILTSSQLPVRLQEQHIAFQGIPGIEGAKGGRLWATWYGGGKEEGVDNAVFLATKTSLQEGTWEFILAVDTPGNVRCFDPCLWYDPQGCLWLFWAQAIPHGESPFVWAMVSKNPQHQQAQWSEPFEVCTGVMMNKPTVLSNGAVLLPVSNWKCKRYYDPPEERTAEVYSLDLKSRRVHYLGGARSEQDIKCYDEHMLLEQEDGRLWMLVRTLYGIGESFSKDGGKSWTTVVPSAIQHVNSRFFIRRLSSGNLLLVKHGAISENVGRTHLKAFLSKDDGRTWVGGLLLDERKNACYPDGFQDEEGRIHIAYDYSRSGDKEILWAVFREDEIEKKALYHEDSELRKCINKAFGKIAEGK